MAVPQYVLPLCTMLGELVTLYGFAEKSRNHESLRRNGKTAIFCILIHSANLMKHFCSKSSQQTNSLMRQRGRKGTALYLKAQSFAKETRIHTYSTVHKVQQQFSFPIVCFLLSTHPKLA